MLHMPSEIIQKLKSGDHKVFKAVYEDAHVRVYHYFLNKLHQEDQAKELTQQTFIKLWNYREDLAESLSMDQQLFQKARLVYIDWLRKEATQRKYFSAELMQEEIQDAQHQPSLESRQKLEWSLRSLPPKRRKVFELKHIHGYSYKEISEFLNISVKTVDNHLLKATVQLKKVFNL